MKSAFATFIVIAFIAVAVFGIFVMNLEASEGHVSCLASTVKGAFCPESAGPLAFIDFHLSAFKSFSSAVFGPAVLVVLLIALVIVIPGIGKAQVFAPGLSTIFSDSRLALEPLLSERRHRHWLALHENSPSFA